MFERGIEQAVLHPPTSAHERPACVASRGSRKGGHAQHVIRKLASGSPWTDLHGDHIACNCSHLTPRSVASASSYFALDRTPATTLTRATHTSALRALDRYSVC